MQSIIFVLIAFGLIGCATLYNLPKERSRKERHALWPDLKSWPIEAPVNIYWNENMIPFVEARSDQDCAFAIGLVHAHLRLGQMELFKRGAAGRLSEAAGPFAAPKVDELLRRLDLGRAAEASYKSMPVNDRNWLDAYIKGINFYQSNMRETPNEFHFLNYQAETWTHHDTFRVSRLAGGDANWASLFATLDLRKEKGWEQAWAKVLEGGRVSTPTIGARISEDVLFSSTMRAGSNSFVVGGGKSATGGALIASDPHLGIFMPNLWLLMGYKCPSYNVVGYMLPGVPAVTLGRNPDIGWGGTYMRGVSSHLFEVKPEQIIGTRSEKIQRRGWFSKSIEIKESTHGPVVFEGKNPQTGQAQMIALSWAGHQASQELSTFLSINRAKNWSEFRASFKDYAVSGLNMTYADRQGNIGFLPAIRLPILEKEEEREWLVKSAGNRVQQYRGPLEHPFVFNPKSHFIASTNNLPVRTDPALAYVSKDNGRWLRLKQLADESSRIHAQDLKLWQQDVFSADSNRFAALLVSHLRDATAPDDEEFRELASWPGTYSIDSKGALIFELTLFHLSKSVFARLPVSPAVQKRISSLDAWRLILENQFNELPEPERSKVAREAFSKARKSVKKYSDWGSFHPQPLQTPLGLIPWVGKRFRFGEFPSPGSAATLHKANFVPSDEPTPVIFGAQSRHVSDLSHPDENYFIMLGGNDGWLKSSGVTDQVPMWREGKYLRVPLNAGEAKARFSDQHNLLEPEKRK